MTEYYLHGMGQALDIAELGLKAATIAAPSIMSVFGGGAGDQIDPAGAQRQQQFQQEELEQAQTQAAAVQQAVAVQQSAQKSSTLTKWLIFGGVGLVILGVGGLMAYRYVRED
jgi:hypothetical protein